MYQPMPTPLPYDWPDIDEPEFIITIDMTSDENDPEPLRPYLVLRVGEREIFRSVSGYENAAHIAEVCKDMRDAYRGRVKDIVLAPGAGNAIYMDDYGAPAKLRRAFRPLRKDYLKAKQKIGE
jgi:hypothetical protein